MTTCNCMGGPNGICRCQRAAGAFQGHTEPQIFAGGPLVEFAGPPQKLKVLPPWPAPAELPRSFLVTGFDEHGKEKTEVITEVPDWELIEEYKKTCADDVFKFFNRGLDEIDYLAATREIARGG